MQYRDYQEDAIYRSIDFMASKSIKKSLLVLPCAAGKSLIIAGIANELAEPVLVLQPTKELLLQNYEKLVNLGGEASIYSASLGIREIGHLTYASIKSIKNDWKKFKELGLKHVLIDEAHYNTKNGGEISKFLKNCKIDKCLGLTATPLELSQRLDGTALIMQNRSRKNLFNQIIHVTQVKELVDKGYWTPIEYQQVSVDNRMLKYNSTGTEFTEASLELFYDGNDIYGKLKAAITNFLEEGKTRILVSVPFVQDAKDLAKAFPDVSASLDAKVNKTDRDSIVSRFRIGKLNVVFQVGILSTGFDYPELEVCIDARPTNSYHVYYQFVGRGVRIFEGKEKFIVLDLAGNFERFGKLESLTFEDVEDYGWGMFVDDILMTDLPLTVLDRPSKDKIGKKFVRIDSVDLKMPYGKHKGELYKNVPIDYCKWALENWDFNNEERKIIKEALIKRIAI